MSNLGGSISSGTPSAPEFSQLQPTPPATDFSTLHQTPENHTSQESPSDQSQEEVEEPSSKHVFYSVELLIFVCVGWGWLAVREYLGKTPVMDVVVLIAATLCAVINLVLSLAISSSKVFAPCAHACLGHFLSLWIVYVYSLSESTRTDTQALCCVDPVGKVQKSTYSIGPTYASAFFAGLPMHQVPAVVTVAFLTILVLIAGAQARTHTRSLGDWELRGLGLGVTALVAVHQGSFLLEIPMCNSDTPKALGVLSVIFGLVAVVLMVDFDWMYSMVYKIFLTKVRTVDQRRNHRLIRSAIQTVGAGFVLVYCFTVASVLEKGISIPLLLVFIICLVSYALGLAYDAVTLYGNQYLNIKEWTPIDARARIRHVYGSLGREMRVPAHLTRSSSVDLRASTAPVPLRRHFPVFLQGQASRGKKSY